MSGHNFIRKEQERVRDSLENLMIRLVPIMDPEIVKGIEKIRKITKEIAGKSGVMDTLEDLMIKFNPVIYTEIAKEMEEVTKEIAEKSVESMDINIFCGKVIDLYIRGKVMPRYIPLREITISPLENECFAVLKKGIVRIDSSTTEFTEIPTLPRGKYSSLLAFQAGEARYLAAGSPDEIVRGGRLRFGVEIANLSEAEEVCSITVERGGNLRESVNSLALWFPRKDDDNATLVVANRGAGVVGVPLNKIDRRTKYLPLQWNNCRDYKLIDNNRNDSLNITAADDVLYIAQGRTVYRLENLRDARELPKHKYKEYPFAISAMDVKSIENSEIVYVATENGQIFCGEKGYFHTERVSIIDNMQAGTLSGRAGLFFCGRNGETRSAVYFTDGKIEEAISLPGSVPIGFSVRGDALWLTSRNESRKEIWRMGKNGSPEKILDFNETIKMIY